MLTFDKSLIIPSAVISFVYGHKRQLGSPMTPWVIILRPALGDLGPAEQ
jgi:hypothetical protein